ncbi:DivIVA domain-containing protein [Hoyosella rhizosphaerae]|uniref:DivIVA domain-containing protein n=1 Tax=Hoyosella rhizosphaerae TaxID=1755582 RepID=A0A916UEF8_9ACTN|nr:DivIVA domain-containing protein [Hoyosella rhizosphaerae]MBN4925602.1 DivIVA domain-containing protein [Hoyosella rhizosphaerae]GGC69361.1 hypothetical protein GCM10011410_22730 [Hoyosella rhizosphaerae]
MTTVFLYVVVIAAIAAVLFLLSALAFGRGEALPPLPPGTTATFLPADTICGEDVRNVRFQQTLRGYKAAEVDWVLEKLAQEIDELRAELDQERM